MSAVPADDPVLHAVVDFLNTHDLLATPVDRLTDIGPARELATACGRADLANTLTEQDLDAMRQLREDLRGAFASAELADKVAAVNTVLANNQAQARLHLADGGVRLAPLGGADAPGELAVLCAGALATVLAGGAADRMRTCAANPCYCTYVDRTRAARQRYCCQLCNDRMAAQAYRQRRATE